jgi:hypothetical protein
MLGDIGDWVYYSLSNSVSIPPYTYRAKLVSGGLESSESTPGIPSGSRPLGRAKQGILWAVEKGSGGAGPAQVDITLGTETSSGKTIAELRAVDFGKTSIHSLTLTDVGINGDWYGGMIGIASWGNTWGNWDPVGIDLTKALKNLTPMPEYLPPQGALVHWQTVAGKSYTVQAICELQCVIGIDGAFTQFTGTKHITFTPSTNGSVSVRGAQWSGLYRQGYQNEGICSPLFPMVEFSNPPQ